ncbi:MAG: hypothetical protein WC250_00430 [Candidatus Paceibacterota bacterium]|jgi:hypothetical protein
MDLKNINQLVKAVGADSKGVGAWFVQAKRDPNRAWEIIFGSFLVVALLLLAFSGYLFVKINRGEIFTVSKPATENLGTIDREKVKQALDAMDRKALKLKEIKNGGTIYVDPSLQ